MMLVMDAISQKGLQSRRCWMACVANIVLFTGAWYNSGRYGE